MKEDLTNLYEMTLPPPPPKKKQQTKQTNNNNNNNKTKQILAFKSMYGLILEEEVLM